MFIEESLYTASGHFVAKVSIPAFKVMPDALLWGERIFIRREDKAYREGFMFAVPPTPQANENPETGQEKAGD